MLFPTTGLNQSHGAKYRVLDKAVGYFVTILHTMVVNNILRKALLEGDI